ncbi:Lipopolysaccharide biosynthesis protein [Archaeoglobus fulgidus DSM 8774]|uniref:Lipopolysaccharide biosynthesis protein n=1 Tax=Archaeoglobus fulgidus DSM 8774 TaxID=1344584 RepID=A0A075W9T2_ARCFL|nr:glycoside hydrolase family 99-like domain-containing protein [Archaeoglobus fulgidus]AIG97130.1 Lipopolysaccharide biosynthesis protein [Archaeoglobus fulgidus DSM 8774]
MLEWTGERYIPTAKPEEVGAEIHYEHLHRYYFAAQFVKGKVVLDLGCGEGYGSYILSKYAKKVVGVDIDDKSIKHASSTYIRSNLEYRVGSVTSIPVDGEEIFDAVICFEVLEHIAEHEEMLQEVKRVLKKDGIFVVSTPNKKVYSDEPNYQNPFHVKELYFDEFKALLGRYFKHIYFFGQRVYPSSQIWCLTEDNDRSSEFVIERGERSFVRVEAERKEPMYFIAIASDSPLKEIDYRSYLTDVSSVLINNFRKYIRHLEKRLRELEVEVGRLNSIVEQKERQIGDLSASLDKLNTEVAEKSGRVYELENALKIKDGELSRLQQEIESLRSAVRDREAEIERLNDELERISGELKDKNEQVSQLTRSLEEKTKELNEFKVKSINLEQKIRGLEGELKEKESLVGKLRRELDEKEKMIGELQQESQKVKSEIAAKDEQIKSLTEENIRLSGELDSIKSSVTWRAVMKWHSFVERVAPLGTRRRRWYDLGVKGLRVLVREGFRSFWRKYKIYKQMKKFEVSDQLNKNNLKQKMNKKYEDFAGTDILFKYFNQLMENTKKLEERPEFVPFSEHEKIDSDIKLVAFYLPQFHPIPENDLFWEKGFTEWTNVTKAVPQFLGHYQPRLPIDLGFYDLRIVDNIKRQVELAKNYGLYGFCFYVYWFGGRKILRTPLDLFYENKDIDIKFCVCWANENWTRRWDGLDDEILLKQQHSPEDDLEFIKDISKYFMDPRYIKVKGKPLLIVYRAELLPDPKSTAERWRKWCRENGIGEIYLACVHSFEHLDPREIGFDAAIDFPPNTYPLTPANEKYRIINPNYRGTIYEYDELVILSKAFKKPPYKKFRGICPGWDNEPRRPGRGTTIVNSTPEKYEDWLFTLCKYTEENFEPEERFIFINAWNEWAESAYLEPDRKYGYAYLEATWKALYKHNRLKTGTKLNQKRIGKWSILFISHDANFGGAQEVLFNVVKWLKSHTRLNLGILFLSGGPLMDKFAQLVPVGLVDPEKVSKSELEKKVIEMLGENPDLIYGNTLVSGKIYDKIYNFCPIITHVHELETSAMYYAGKALDKVIKYSDAYIACSNAVKEFLVGKFGVNSEKIYVIHSFIRPSEKSYLNGKDKLKLRRSLGIDAGKLIVIGCGLGLPFRKGADLFIDVGKEIKKRGLDSRIALYWIGGFDENYYDPVHGYWRSKLAEIKENRLNVKFLGFVDDPRKYMEAADIFLLPSREDPFPLVMLEAADAGLPIICFDKSGGAPEFVKDGFNGYVVPFKDIDAIVDKLEYLLNNQNEVDRLGGNAKLEVRKYYIDSIMPKILSTVRKVAKMPPSITVIVPNYNHEKFLDKRLESIFSQTFQDFEVILMDDASTDSSPEILREWANKRDDVTLILNETNSGSPFKQWVKALPR